MTPSRAHDSRGVVGFLLGPWPFFPLALTGVIVAVLVVRAFGRASALSDDIPGAAAIAGPNLLVAIVGACGTGLLAWAVPRVADRVHARHDGTTTRWRYLLEVLLVGFASAVFVTALTRIVFIEDSGDPHAPLVQSLATSVPFSVVVLLLLNGVLGSVDARVRRTERLLAERLAESEFQRAAILAADERVRREIAASLHDDVQTRLLRAAIRLGTIRARIVEEDRAAFEESIADLEDVREHGVRALGRRLAPNLAVTGLPTALRERAEAYAGAMDVAFSFDDEAVARLHDDGAEQVSALAAYRIVEQALQNALKHGRAERAAVTIDAEGDRGVRVIVVADGDAPPSSPAPGEGTRIVQSWLETVGGSWRLEPGPDGGSRFVALIGRS